VFGMTGDDACGYIASEPGTWGEIKSMFE